MPFLFLLSAACLTYAAEVREGIAGKNVRTVKFQSESLGQERAFNILLPADYDSSTRRYPTLYLLHGLGDDHTAWAYMTNLSGYAVHHNIIIVMPDASKSWYVNSAADPKARFEDMIVKDLIPFVDSHYRTIPLPRSRAVAGLSMGGYGAAFLGL
ncbi:MAG: esterase family protein, partial [Acidobacteria bacterium]|nr:esterase family protein [Acidobacteriota bacterium]